MNLSRPTRFFASLVALFCLLFTQLAVASYACAGVEQAAQAAVMANSGLMPNCANMDMNMDAEQSGLCHAHCDPGHQSSDTPAAPQVPPFVTAGLALVLPDLRLATLPLAVHSGVPLLAHAAAPPLAIRNCCFRI